MTLAEAKDYINKNLPDRLKASDPMYKAGIVRAVLFVVLDAAQGLIDALKEKFDAKTITCTSLNGLAINRAILVSPNGAPSDTSVRFLKFASLKVSSDGLYDILGVRLVIGSWGSLPKGTIEATFGNRGGLICQYNQYNDPASCGLVAYQQADGTATIYVRYPNNFRSASLSIEHNLQATIFDTWVEEVPTGTLVFDSTNINAYQPTLLVNQSLTFSRGYTQMGPGKAYQITDLKAGSNLSVNPNKYLEFKQADGTIAKLAVLN